MSEQKPEGKNVESSALLAEPCPTRGGSGPLYQPQFQNCDGKWLDIKTKRSAPGIPAPLLHGGIAQEVGLYGYEQAMALAWQYAACAAASDGIAPPVRALKYRMTYEIKCWRDESPNTGTKPPCADENSQSKTGTDPQGRLE